ncbi:MAG: hypothetical protein Q8O67_29225 [Deltaproteobacteria bacterium]|nr:hypothetical protein [Deltaproteobacteria bacterium]
MMSTRRSDDVVGAQAPDRSGDDAERGAELGETVVAALGALLAGGLEVDHRLDVGLREHLAPARVGDLVGEDLGEQRGKRGVRFGEPTPDQIEHGDATGLARDGRRGRHGGRVVDDDGMRVGSSQHE